MIKYIDETNFKTEVLNSKDAVLVDFFATWCGPCSMLSPVLEKISNSRADFNIVKVDIDKLRDLALDYGIEVVPTLLIFKDGTVVDKIEGMASEEEIISKMLEYK